MVFRFHSWLSDDSVVIAPNLHHFAPPWFVEEEFSCFVVCDHSGRVLAHIYYEEEPGRRSAAKLLNKDEARRIAANFAKQPG
jgi:hypothetical protein